jgi:hypothetical protein
MHGRTTARIACRLALALGAVAAGCDDAPTETPPAGPCAEAASAFEPDTAGAIEGRVTWDGDVPAVAPFRSPVNPLSHPDGHPRPWDNPNAPVVDARSKGVAGAVVFLRGIDPCRARPWDHPPVRVVMCDQQFHIRQGDADTRVGFARRGEAVQMVSEEPVFHSLQARGEAFFSLVFPDAGRPRRRSLTQPGLVELSSGAGYFWMRAYLFVDDHPYYTRTDAEGRFRLEQVPPGEYDVVCWMPNWHEAGHERDGDTCLVCRLTFRPPVEVVVKQLALGKRETRTVRFTLSADLLGR